MQFIIILKTKDLGDIMKHKKYSMSITEDERQWIHELAKAEKKSIALMIIQCLRKKSEHLGISLPRSIIPYNKRQYQGDYHDSTKRETSFRKIMKEDLQITFL